MFDRGFFEQQFHEQTRAFARDHKVASPVVEFLLDDGSVLYVRSVVQTKEHWLCLLAYDEEATRQVYCPYYCIKRITFHVAPPKNAARRELAFQPGGAPRA
jgi:hypothetical protein